MEKSNFLRYTHTYGYYIIRIFNVVFIFKNDIAESICLQMEPYYPISFLVTEYIYLVHTVQITDFIVLKIAISKKVH